MPKLYLLQGDRDEDFLKEFAKSNNVEAVVNVFQIAVSYTQLSAQHLRNTCRGVAGLYMEGNYNIAIHDLFLKNEDAKLYVMMADAFGYEIQFIRLPHAYGEELSWQECFAS